MAAGKMFVAAKPVMTRTRGRPRKYAKPFGKYNVSKPIKNYVYNAIQAQKESKIDGVQNSTATTTAGDFILLNGIGQGAASGQREGDEIYNKSIRIQGFFKNEDTESRRVRLVLLVDYQSNGSLPTLAQLFDVETTNVYDGALRERENMRRFIFLRDMFFTLAPTGESGDQKIVKLYKKLNFKTKYDASSGTAYTDILKGTLWLLKISSDDTTGVTTSLSCNYRFKD